MAYLLRFSGGENVSIPNIGISNAVGFKITVDASFGGFSGSFLPILGRVGSSNQRIMLSGTSASNITGLRFGGTAANTIPAFDWSTRKTVSIESTATTIIVKIDDVLHAEVTRTIDYVTAPLNVLFLSSSNKLTSGDIYSVTIENGGVLDRRYNPTASGGSGDILPEVESSQNGALVGFIIPDCWVFYEDGGAVTSTIAATWPQLSIAASQASTIPDNDSTAAFTWPQLSIASDQLTVAPVSNSAAFNWPQLSVSASQSSAAPQFDSAVNFTWPQLTISTEQSAAYSGNVVNFTWPQLSVLANQSATIPDADAAGSFTWPQLTVGINQITPVDNPEYNFPISGYRNNNQWRFSPFFKQTK